MTLITTVVSHRTIEIQTDPLTPRAVLHRITSGKIEASKLGEGRTSAYVIAASEIERIQQAS